MQSLSSGANFNFNAGVSWSQGSSFDFSEFEVLALRMLDYTDSTYTVRVVNQGGEYSSVGASASWYDLYDFRWGGQGEDNGYTLAVFTGEGTVCLKKYQGRQFGPSVLAPFARVVVDGDVGYVDG